MSSQRHVIQRQILELTVHDGADARQLQADVSRLYRQRIVPLIDQYCTELSEPDRTHRIESLEIDLGTINTSRLEVEFVAKLEAALLRALAAQISRQEQEADGHGPDLKTRSQLELLAFFARTGSLPWWVEAQQPRLLEECLEHLLRTAPEALRRSMAELATEPAALRRLSHHYSDELLARLVATLVPALESVLADEVPILIKLLQTSKAAAGQSPARLRLLVWTNCLHVAGLSGGQQRTMEQFYQAVLVRLAAGVDTSYKELLADFFRTAQQAGDKRLASRAETFEFLLDNSLPAPETPDTEVISRLETVLRSVAAQLPPSIQENMLTLLARLNANAPVDETVQRIFHLLGSQLSPEEMSKLNQLMQREGWPAALPPRSIDEMQSRSSTMLKDEAAVDLSFSEADALYIHNAGLVILWPFLSHFFACMELLEEKQFRDSAARQRAIGLLQHLATGESSFPEYLLPLNKVLCGAALGEVFDFDPPLTEAEAEECITLLAAVIGQAPILRDMSVSGLRGTFLLRPGMLSSRDGAWLLRVERETYDIVLDRFPWGWEWVKLPWMEAPLRVEW